MDWNAVSPLGQIVGAVAVVTSLAYLARQVALANRLAQAEAWRSRHAELTTLNAAFGVDPRLHRAMVKAYAGAQPPELKEDEVSLIKFVCDLHIDGVFPALPGGPRRVAR